jgi:excisionase family DNA binding protein
MASEFIETLQKVESTALLLNKMGGNTIDEAVERIKLISESIAKFGDIAKIIEYAREMESQLYLCKSMLTLDEAAKYMRASKSLLYKMTSSRQITYYKPTGKGIYIERAELDELMKTNPMYSRKELERIALSNSLTSTNNDKKKKKGGSK